MEQISMLPSEDVEELAEQVKRSEEYAKQKRRWENAFQKWSNEHSQDGSNSYGCCGYGSMCDYCIDNSYGRPCVRALNAMLREQQTTIDYSKRNFEDVWRGRM